MQTFAYALLLATQAAAATALPEPAAAVSADTARWWREYSTGVRSVPIENGRTLKLFCMGSGSPTVMLEAGRGNRIPTWHKVQPVLARRYRVCAYNRAGIDGSSPGPMPRDAVAIVSDLEKLIRHAQQRPPYILVGHSLGGLTIRLFARRNMRQTAGIVLVDPSGEDMLARIAPISREYADLFRKDVDRFQRCAAQPYGSDCTLPVPDDLPPSLRGQLTAHRPDHWFWAMASEVESLSRANSDSAQIKAAGTDLGAIPMVLLTAESMPSGLPEAQRPALVADKIAMHKAIAGKSRRGVQKTITGTSHSMQFDRPEAVIEAVDQVASVAATPATAASDFGNSELEVEGVRQAEQERLRSLVAADMAAARRLHADDFQVVNPLGLTASREQYLGYIANGTVDYLRWEPGPIVVRQSGRMAAIRYKSTVDMITRGERRPTREAWNTGLYEHRDGRWQIVWFQATEIATTR